MIYAIGDKAVCEPYLVHGTAVRLNGVNVWKHMKTAQTYADKLNKGRPERYRFRVYGLDAVWGKDTKPDPTVGRGVHETLRDCKLIELSPLLPELEDISESLEAKIGAVLAKEFKLKRDKEHKDRWQLAGGTKTDIGVFRTAVGIIKNHENYA